MMRVLATTAVCFLLISCGKKSAVPSEFIQPPKMQVLLWDYIRADALTTQQKHSFTSPEALSENAELQQQVFAIHGVSKDQFYKSLDYYKSHPVIMKNLMDSVVSKATRERVNILPINPALVK